MDPKITFLMDQKHLYLKEDPKPEESHQGFGGLRMGNALLNKQPRRMTYAFLFG